MEWSGGVVEWGSEVVESWNGVVVVVGSWRGKVVEWSSGVVEWWRGGVVELWSRGMG